MSKKIKRIGILTGGGVWLNESEADKHVLNPFGDSEHSVLVIQRLTFIIAVSKS